jgi:hypothetical protein
MGAMLQTTVLALLGLSAGLALHFRWHPLRREFSDAWDFLRLRQPLVLLVAGCLLFHPGPGRSLMELEDWQDLWPHLLREACAGTTQLFHELAPPWPLALVLPLLLVLLTVRVWRWPYRYGERVPVPEQKLLLIGLSAAGLLWLGLEAAAWQAVYPEWLETVKLAARTVFAALTTAGVQVWLVRLVVAWERPPDTDAEGDAVTALEATFARWQSVVLLGGFDLLWMAWHAWRPEDTGPAAWLLPEFWLLFAAVPVAVAVSSGKSAFWLTGAVALKALRRSLPVLAGYLISAVAVTMLGRYAAEMAQALGGTDGWLAWLVRGVSALALAMLRGWLCLAAILVMLRHGFSRSHPAAPAR